MLGVLIADIATAVTVWMSGVSQRLVLGGAGAADMIVISGLTAVLLAELAGELIERMARGSKRPSREFKNGKFVEKERSE